MSRALRRLERLHLALAQARLAAERDVAEASVHITALEEQKRSLSAALERQADLADLLFSPTLTRLARLGLEITAAENRLAQLRQALIDWAIRHKLVGQRLIVTRQDEERRQQEQELGEMMSRRAWAERSSLRQGR